MQVTSFTGTPAAYLPSQPSHLGNSIQNLSSIPSQRVYYPQNGQSPEAEAIDIFSGKIYEMLTERKEHSETLIGIVWNRAWDLLAEMFTFLQPKSYAQANENSRDRRFFTRNEKTDEKGKRNIEVWPWPRHEICYEKKSDCSYKTSLTSYSSARWKFYLFKQRPLAAYPTNHQACIYTDYHINLGNETYADSFRLRLMLSDCTFSSQQEKCIAENLGVLFHSSDEFLTNDIFEMNSTEPPIHSFTISVPSTLTNATWKVKVDFLDHYYGCTQAGCSLKTPSHSFSKAFVRNMTEKTYALPKCENQIIKTQILVPSFGLPLLISGAVVVIIYRFRKHSIQNREKNQPTNSEYGTFP